MADVVSILAESREQSGKGSARSLRREGKIPAIIYGANKKPLSITLPEKEITKYYRKPQYISQVFEFEIGGKKHKVLPKDIQLDPITEVVTHADYVFLEKDIQKMKVPVVYKNKMNCLGVKRGGYFNTVKRSLLVSCPVDSLLRKIEIDVTNMGVGVSLKVKDIKVPEGVKLHEKSEFVIASIIGKKGKNTDSEEGEGAEGDTAGEAAK